ncbi:MAG: hypothetical protein ABL888_18855 [Pirellulaceae bacterium]
MIRFAILILLAIGLANEVFAQVLLPQPVHPPVSTQSQSSIDQEWFGLIGRCIARAELSEKEKASVISEALSIASRRAAISMESRPPATAIHIRNPNLPAVSDESRLQLTQKVTELSARIERLENQPLATNSHPPFQLPIYRSENPHSAVANLLKQVEELQAMLERDLQNVQGRVADLRATETPPKKELRPQPLLPRINEK